MHDAWSMFHSPRCIMGARLVIMCPRRALETKTANATDVSMLCQQNVKTRKLAPARVSHWDDVLISDRVYMVTGSFHILLFKGTFHVDKIHVWFKIENITHALPVPAYRETDFTPKRVVVSRLHDTVARFRTGVKFSPRHENRGELTPRWLAPA